MAPMSEASGQHVGADDWDRHWQDFSVANERNPAQTYRHRLGLRLLRCNAPGARLLDVGSGQGAFLARAARRCPEAELAGIELSILGVEETRAKVPGALVEQRDLLADDLDPGALAGWATHAFCSEVLEHVDDPVRLLRGARTHLAPGCRLVVTVPGGRMSAFDRHIGHRRHFTPNDLAAILREAGFEIEEAAAAGFPFFNLYRMLVIARGERLVDDVGTPEDGDGPPLAARVAMAAFDPLFRLNLTRSPWGLQTLAVATLR
jgi:2-polyprenyl-3-methyl-5-hydroxy-6-metoxy-1,4-benzoquinol methylase